MLQAGQSLQHIDVLDLGVREAQTVPLLDSLKVRYCSSKRGGIQPDLCRQYEAAWID
ncbi:hypothetical protein GCM10027419_08300 [Pandoraea terrae]